MKKICGSVRAAAVCLTGLLVLGGCGSSGGSAASSTGSTGVSDAARSSVSSVQAESKLSGSAGGESVASSSEQGMTLELQGEVSTPDAFQWSGGSGRVQITCDKIAKDGDQYLAELVFSSTHYQYVKVDGVKYYGTHEGKTSVFVIPAKINENFQIGGLTTAMSQPHEVQYTVYIAAGSGNAVSLDALLQRDSLDKTAPDILGMTASSEQPETDAAYFRIFEYENGAKLLEIDTHTDAGITAESSGKGSAGSSSEKKLIAAQEAELYSGNVVKYLIVPENAEVAAGLEKQVILIRQPVDSVYVADDDAEEFMEDLSLDSKITEKGEASAIPDFKTLVKEKIDLVIQSSDILEDEGASDMEQDMTELGVPLLLVRSSDEQSEAARGEWEKVYRAVFGA